jgi:hypothetical protein
VQADGQATPAADHGVVARRQLPEPGEQRLGLRHEAVVQVSGDRPGGHLARGQRLHFRRETEHPAGRGVHQRFLPHPVPGKDELVAPDVVEGDRERAPEMEHEIRAVLLVEMGDDLAVAVAAQAVAAPGQAGSELAIVVDLAVVDTDHGLRAVRERLVGTSRVGDGEPRADQAAAGDQPDPPGVRPAMGEPSRHLAQGRRVGRPGRVTREGARYSAHSQHPLDVPQPWTTARTTGSSGPADRNIAQ